jgi:hypothetical protein
MHRRIKKYYLRKIDSEMKILGFCEKHQPKVIELNEISKEEVMCYEVLDDKVLEVLES